MFRRVVTVAAPKISKSAAARFGKATATRWYEELVADVRRTGFSPGRRPGRTGYKPADFDDVTANMTAATRKDWAKKVRRALDGDTDARYAVNLLATYAFGDHTMFDGTGPYVVNEGTPDAPGTR
ncbi:hypothetical protein [Actinoplanes sp. DH11]|uniref:hypothetical protein n=1 Tax=Actinoplanes sp. DH11 TaxID=2857011 RepID=UPI001E51D791|nr:hypothetical protein [Actinoplanes sp. DH11]